MSKNWRMRCLGLIACLAIFNVQANAQSQAPDLSAIAPELRDAARIIPLVEISDAMVRAARASAAKGEASGPMPPRPRLADVSVAEQIVPAADGEPAVKLFVINARPGGSRPAILHTHGGGFVFGSAETDVPFLQNIARELDCVIVSVEYRLAPETNFKGSTEDNYRGLQWLNANAQSLGVDRARIAVMGESAGGGHAALLAIAARDRKQIPILFQMLIYPMLDDRTASSRPVPEQLGTVIWGPQANRFGWGAFLGQQPGTDTVPVAAVPARTVDLKGLPPTYIAVGGADLFVQEDIDYARRLIEAGVETQLIVVPGAFHAFEMVSPDLPVSKAFVQARIDALRRAFSRDIVNK